MAKGTTSNELNDMLTGYLKHLTTLSVVVIVLITAFLQSVYVGPGLGLFVGVAVLGFLVSTITSVTFYTLLAFGSSDVGSDFVPLSNRMTLIAAVGAWGGFLVGVIGLAAFTLLRLLQTPIAF
jgi:hypothetical protein